MFSRSRSTLIITVFLCSLATNVFAHAPHQGEYCPVPTTTVPTQTTGCGNGICSSSQGETPTTCPQDCGRPGNCGDGVCSSALGENSTTCPQDCGSSTGQCGNGICSSSQGESCTTCPGDCGVCTSSTSTTSTTVPRCGDGVCRAPENCHNCPQDCSRCGDGICSGSETFATCPLDCRCGNYICEDNENPTTCACDCRASCGNNVCDSNLGENFVNCPKDCRGCGDGICSSTETRTSCALDCRCTGGVANGFCDALESSRSCPEDCRCRGGAPNGVCTECLPTENQPCGETTANCPQDCRCTGGIPNGYCDPTESNASCPQDCRCNNNGVCESNLGETCDNCPNDCHRPTTTTTTVPNSCPAGQVRIAGRCITPPVCDAYRGTTAAYTCIRFTSLNNCKGVSKGISRHAFGTLVYSTYNGFATTPHDFEVWCYRGSNQGNISPVFPESNLICACVRVAGCFHPDTQISLADGNTKAAKDISVKDKLLNPITGQSLEISTIVESKENVSMIEFGYGARTIKVSQEHPVPVEGSKIKKARDLNLGDLILDASGNYHQIDSIRSLPVESGQRVINFTLNTKSEDPADHYLLSDGIVTGDLYLQGLIK